MAVKRIVTNIATPQVDAARRFYGAVLGLEVVMTFAAKGGNERSGVVGRIVARTRPATPRCGLAGTPTF